MSTIRFLGCCDECPPVSQAICDDSCDTTFEIEVTWTTDFEDLDVGIKYDGSTAGYECDNGQNPLFSSGDVRGTGGTEIFHVLHGGGAKDIEIFCHWYDGNAKGGGTGNVNLGNSPIQIKVTNGTTVRTKTVQTMLQYDSCSCHLATNQLARVWIRDSGFWTIVNP
jgi:hypothetical protein